MADQKKPAPDKFQWHEGDIEWVKKAPSKAAKLKAAILKRAHKLTQK